MGLAKNNIESLPENEWPVDSLGKPIPQKTLVQWKTATVVDVQVGEDNPTPIIKDDDQGVIYVQIHSTVEGIMKETYAKFDDANRCLPLIRGMNDLPVPGEQVLIADFAGVNYYLGPLNTNNHINYNADHLRTAVQTTSGQEMGNTSDPGYNSTMIPLSVRRLTKNLNPKLDNPLMNTGEKDPETGEVIEDFLMPDHLNISGDMIFEGRYGNSIRIGSRNVNPYMILSNGRAISNTVETTLDGSIIGIFNNGSIRQHFHSDNKRVETKNEETGKAVQGKKTYSFSLADTEINEKDDTFKPKRSIAQTLTTSMGRGLGPTESEHNETYNRSEPGGKGNEKAIPDPDINDTIYNYSDNQLFMSSDRITINARKSQVIGEGDDSIEEGDGSIYIAANKYLNFGSGNNINLSTSNTFLVEAATSMIVNTPMFKVSAPGKVYIDGRKNTDKNDEIVGSIFLGNPLLGDKMSQAVLGDALCSWLCMLISELQNICASVSECVENRHATGASFEVMSQRADALDSLMGVTQKTLQDGSTVAWPENMAKWILSDSVMVKK